MLYRKVRHSAALRLTSCGIKSWRATDVGVLYERAMKLFVAILSPSVFILLVMRSWTRADFTEPRR